MNVKEQIYSHPAAPGILAKNPFEVVGDTAVLTMTGGKTVTIDLADLPLVAAHRWCSHSNGYAKTVMNGRLNLMHRYIMGFTKTEIYTDHKNGDRSDNRRGNLRTCTCAENSRNQTKQSNNLSGFKGVSFCKTSRKNPWIAKIRADGKDIYLGLFPAVEVAARAYDNAAKEHHGAFARLNFPEPEPPVLAEEVEETVTKTEYPDGRIRTSTKTKTKRFMTRRNMEAMFKQF